MAALTIFIQPPLFSGKEEEDVTEWMDRYEKIGNYDRWGDVEKRAHVELSLTGAAQKWFSYKGKAGQLATDWGTAAGPPVVTGTRNGQWGCWASRCRQWRMIDWIVWRKCSRY
jgi:hypothetical protein